MSLFLPRTSLVLLFCLAFVGQAVASTVMSYHMIGMQQGMNMQAMSGQAQSHNMSKMDHNSHSMTSGTNLSDSNNSSDDCCSNTCDCFTGGCSTTAVLIEDLTKEHIVDFSTKIHFISNLALSQQLNSLYRPPILS